MRLGTGGETQTLRSPTSDASPDQTKSRGSDEPHDRYSIKDNSDVYGELIAARQEFACAVERIDEREACGQRGRLFTRGSLL
jgi:hypothetical protein